MRDRFVRVTTELLDSDPHVALVLADISVSAFAEAGVLDRYPNRIINVGIREQLLIGVAAGMAMEGFRPIVHTYAPFIVERPYEQVKLDLGHQGAGAVLVSVGASYDAANSGRTHQAPEDVALLSTLPDWQIHVPGHADEAEAVLRSTVSGSGCAYIRLSEATNTSAVNTPSSGFTLMTEGSSNAITVIAVGPMLDRVMEATADFDVTILYAVTVRPFDGKTLRAVIRNPDIVIVEPYLAGTSAAEICSALGGMPVRLLNIGVPRMEHRHYGTGKEHDQAHHLDVEGIRSQIADLLGTI